MRKSKWFLGVVTVLAVSLVILFAGGKQPQTTWASPLQFEEIRYAWTNPPRELVQSITGCLKIDKGTTSGMYEAEVHLGDVWEGPWIEMSLMRSSAGAQVFVVVYDMADEVTLINQPFLGNPLTPVWFKVEVTQRAAKQVRVVMYDTLTSTVIVNKLYTFRSTFGPGFTWFSHSQEYHRPGLNTSARVEFQHVDGVLFRGVQWGQQGWTSHPRDTPHMSGEPYVQNIAGCVGPANPGTIEVGSVQGPPEYDLDHPAVPAHYLFPVTSSRVYATTRMWYGKAMYLPIVRKNAQ